MVTKKLSAKLASETEFYIDFKPLTFGPFLNKPKMAYSRDALLENSKRQERDKTRVGLERERLERDKRETREIWSYGGWPIIV